MLYMYISLKILLLNQKFTHKFTYIWVNWLKHSKIQNSELLLLRNKSKQTICNTCNFIQKEGETREGGMESLTEWETNREKKTGDERDTVGKKSMEMRRNKKREMWRERRWRYEEEGEVYADARERRGPQEREEEGDGKEKKKSIKRKGEKEGEEDLEKRI